MVQLELIVSPVWKTTKQETDAKDQWSWVEASVWTESMLAALEKGVKGGCWYSLIDKVYAKKTLEAAWRRVASNKGSGGIDDISIERFYANEEKYLQELHEALKEGTYQPLPVKRIQIPKDKGQNRPLGIPTIKDRIVQTAIKMVIEPIFAYEFCKQSYGFIPQRGCKDALRRVDELVKLGNTEVVDADVESFFDSLDHEIMMQRIKLKISDGKLLKLIEDYLKQDIMEGLDQWTPTMGTPQGSVLSPLLANIYLHPLDVEMEQSGYQMVRYADDSVILCNSEQQAQEALKKVQEWVEENQLNLHPQKTRTGNCLVQGQGFEFLGYKFERGNRWVRKKSLRKLKDKIRRITKRTRGDSLGTIIEELNPVLKGWYGYFKHAHRYTFSQIDGFVRRRLRSLKYKQLTGQSHFGKSRKVNMLWTNNFFAEQGLFTLKEAYVLACQSR